jgi:hypothetical protein
LDVDSLTVNCSPAGGGPGGLQIDNITDINANASSSGTLWIGQIQVGMQYEVPINCYGARFFARGMFDFQTWSLPSALNGLIAGGGTDDIEMYGVVFGAGVIR